MWFQVCPVIINFTEADSMDDYRTEAVAVRIPHHIPHKKNHIDTVGTIRDFPSLEIERPMPRI